MEKGVRNWNDHIKKVISDKREGFNKFISVGKIEDKIDYSYKRSISK
jgi:hypothetical protein